MKIHAWARAGDQRNRPHTCAGTGPSLPAEQRCRQTQLLSATGLGQRQDPPCLGRGSGQTSLTAPSPQPGRLRLRAEGLASALRFLSSAGSLTSGRQKREGFAQVTEVLPTPCTLTKGMRVKSGTGLLETALTPPSPRLPPSELALCTQTWQTPVGGAQAGGPEVHRISGDLDTPPTPRPSNATHCLTPP